MPSKSSALAVIFPCTLAALAIVSSEPSAWGQQTNQSPGRARVQTGPERPAAAGEPAAQPPQQARVAAVPQFGPQLEAILREWSNESAMIRRLEGEHIRHVFDTTYKTEERTQGMFYYTAPDRGRIDFEGFKIKPGAQAIRAGFALQSGQTEIWICDGTRILSLDPTAKTGEAVVIPPSNRGVNIMDGPLPFLFGMPPEMAKQRYQMTLRPETSDTHVWLTIVPRWQVDAANYKTAQVVLDRQQHFLPLAVELEDPYGTRKTLYKFSKFKINGKAFVLIPGIGEDPLSDKAIKKLESSYQLTISDPGANAPAQPQDPAPQPGNAPPVANRPPAVIGFEWEAASQLLKRAGYEVKFLKGDPAPSADLVYRVQNQKLIPPQEEGQKPAIALYCYLEMLTAEKSDGQQPK